MQIRPGSCGRAGRVRALAPAGPKVIGRPAGLICGLRGLCQLRGPPKRPPEGPGSSENCSLPACWKVNSNWRPRTTLPRASGYTVSCDLPHPHSTPTPPHTRAGSPRTGPAARDPFPVLLRREAFSRPRSRRGREGWGGRGERRPQARSRARSPNPARAAGPAAPSARAARAPAHTIHGFLLISNTPFSLCCPPTENKRPFLKSPEM